MNKNLKKVISAVAALAVSASSIVAFAAGYPDVPETASYAQAVTELSALNVINGYEDGTFAPDKNVTRAEITKMIVTALGSSSLSAAEAATGKDTQFDDVKGTHWASGFVTVGTSSGTQFINGYSATEFGPDDNVTYAQAIKMLVGALGYTTYAENNGGWPNGYLTWGYNLDITKGVTGVSNDTQVTRAQVAQMIDNAVKAPICVIDGYDTQWNGTQTPRLVEKNTPSTSVKDSWQCLLNYSHDAYIVNGRVQATHKSDPSVETDKVRISIEKADNYDGLQVTKNFNATTELAYIGESGADNYLLTYAEMIVQMNEDDELTVLSIVPAGSNKTATFAAEDFDDEKYEITGTGVGTIYAYVGSTTKTTSYKIDLDKINLGTEGGFYVNGVQAAGSLADNIAKYITGDATHAANTTGEVTLIDSPAQGESATDGRYDYIMVTYYRDAVVDSVIGDEDECTVYFSEMDTDLDPTFEVDLTDDDKYYSFTLTDGTAVKATELQENDVLSIAYNVAGGSFYNSNSYDVLVSRDTVEGKLTSINPDADATKTEYTVNGSTYKIASANLVNDLTTGYEYTMYLDAFGRIAKFEETAASKNLGILDNVYVADGDQSYVTIITSAGVKTRYSIKDENLENYKKLCFVNGQSGTKLPVQQRVYGYSVSSTTNYLTLKGEDASKLVTDGDNYYTAKEASNEPYKLNSNKIGQIRLNDAVTAMLDLSEYDSDGTINVMTIDALEDDNEYTAYGFNKISDSSYQLVLVTEGGNGSITYKTEFAIFSKRSTQDVDGDDKIAYTIYEADKKTDDEGNVIPSTVILDDESVDVAGLTEGTPIVVKKNSSGYVSNVYPLFKVSLGSGYKNFADAVRADMKSGKLTTNESSVLNVDALNTTLTKGGSSASKTSSWKFGMVYDRNGSNSLTLVTKFDNVTTSDEDTSLGYISNIDEAEELDFDPAAKVLVYDYKQRANQNLRVANGILSSIVAVNATNAAFVDGTDTALNKTYTQSDNVLINWQSSALGYGSETSTYGRVSYALVKLVDNDIVEAYVIVPSTSRN